MQLRRWLRQAASLVLAACLALSACGNDCSGSCGTAGGPTDIRLEVDEYIAGLDKPWDIAWLPNGTLLLTERTGQLKVFVDGADEPPWVIPIADVVARGEGGLMGLEVDPDFASNGFIYVCTTSNAGGDNEVRLLRLTMSRTDEARVLDRSDIVTGMPYSSGRHSGCRPRFGPDGFLWVGTGDAAIGANPQDDTSLGGKVLRIDREGAAAPGNPNGLLWYSKGHRNVQGMAFRSDGIGVSAEHGPSIDDELNLLVPGNFGWDPVPGYNESVPMTDLAKFPDAVEAIWSSGSPTLALAGATFIEGETWGDWNGALAVATLKAEHLHAYFIDAEGQVTGEERAIEDQGRLRSPRQGPDGLLYITNDGGSGAGKVLRVRPVPIPPSP
jgi:glucose/arabinose dehydrogenase